MGHCWQETPSQTEQMQDQVINLKNQKPMISVI